MSSLCCVHAAHISPLLSLSLSFLSSSLHLSPHLPPSSPPPPPFFTPFLPFSLQVRKALGVGDRVWEGCNDPVYFAFMLDFPRNIEPRVVQLLEGGVRVLVYAGDKDYICNWIGERGRG